MPNVIIYDSVGNILRWGRCSKRSLGLQAAHGEYIKEGVANDITQKIVNGEIVDKTPEEIKTGKL